MNKTYLKKKTPPQNTKKHIQFTSHKDHHKLPMVGDPPVPPRHGQVTVSHGALSARARYNSVGIHWAPAAGAGQSLGLFQGPKMTRAFILDV